MTDYDDPTTPESDTINGEAKLADPFGLLLLNETEELDALARALSLTDGFALFIASCNQAPQRDRLMNEIEARLPNARIQRIPVQQKTRNLIYLLRALLDEPTPDAVFVYGMEAWMPAGEAVENSPFVLNLNAARNYYPEDVPCSMLLWLPQHLVTAIAHGAPDFFSVRSGLYAFAPTPQAREHMLESFASQNWTGALGLPLNEKSERIKQLTEMLHEYQALPDDLRNYSAEAQILNALATVYETLGNYHYAEPLYKQALTIQEKALGLEHPDTANSLNNLANLYNARGRYTEAKPLYRQALAIREKTLGLEHPYTANILNNLAALYYSQGRYAEAEPLFMQALAIREKTLGLEHPDTANSLNNLANLYNARGRYAEAEPLYRQALAIKEKTLGLEHPYTAYSLNSLAVLYYSQGRYAEAEPLFMQVLAIREKTLGLEHPDTANSLNNIAWLYDVQGRKEEAELFFTCAREAEEAHKRRNAAQ